MSNAANPNNRHRARTMSSSSSKSSHDDSLTSLTYSSSCDGEEFEFDPTGTSPLILDKTSSKEHVKCIHSRKYRCGRFLRSRSFLCTAAIVWVVLFILYIDIPAPTDHHVYSADHSQDDLGETNLMDIRRCSYEDLDRAFRGVIPPPQFENTINDTATRLEGESETKCWNLAEEVLRIPAMAIDHRHMVRLGGGFKGGVYAVAVRLSKKPGSEDKCIVAMKSDHCHMKNPLRSNWLDKRTKHSCIERKTFLLNPSSYMGAEYNGAIIYHSLQKMKKQLGPKKSSFARRAEHGLLPTWAVVQDVGHPMRSVVPHKKLYGFPHDDATIKAVIMPIVDMEPLSSMSKDHKKDLVRSARSIAQAMLPAANGLAAVAGMRLAFLDILDKNVGFRIKNRTAVPLEFSSFLYDQSFLTYQDHESCKLPENENAGCSFCMDPNFHRNPIRDDLATDVRAFVAVILRLIKSSPDTSPDKQNLIDTLRESRTAQDLVRVLEQVE